MKMKTIVQPNRTIERLREKPGREAKASIGSDIRRRCAGRHIHFGGGRRPVACQWACPFPDGVDRQRTVRVPCCMLKGQIGRDLACVPFGRLRAMIPGMAVCPTAQETDRS